MTKFKIPNFFNSFRNKLILIIALLVIASLVLITQIWLKKNDNSSSKSDENSIKKEDKVTPDLNEIQKTFESNIDSIFASFGIKKEWISTQYNSHNDKSIKNSTKDAQWFVKTVQIPRDLSSIEVNLDLSSFIKSAGLEVSSVEDIATKDISITVLNTDTLKSKLPLVKINVNHSDKVSRESALFSFIINGIGDYTEEEIDKLVINKPEFSYVFPRNLDEINIQNRLLTHKKDLLINLTIGGKENYDTDFHSSLDDKSIKEKVKSFSSDFPSIRNVILTRTENEVPPSVINAIADEFAKYNIYAVKDSAVTKLLTSAEEESKDKISILFNNLMTKSTLAKSIVTVIKIEPDEIEKFYNEVIILKKLGYKFLNYSEFLTKAAEIEKARKEKEEKIKEEKLKEDKKKQDKKQPEKKQDKKKQPEKKSTDKKPIDKKKAETKKPTTNDKKKK